MSTRAFSDTPPPGWDPGYRAGREDAVKDAKKAIEALDELAVKADWDNSDDIAYEVKKACIAALSKVLEPAPTPGTANGS